MSTTNLPAANGHARTVGDALAHASTGGSYSIQPQTFGELQAFCTMIANSDLAPKDYRGKPGNVLVAVQMGSEIGLKPMQAIQNIAVINGRPSVWGDAALALIKQHPAFQSCREWFDGQGDAETAYCEMIRRGEPPVVRSFSLADAKAANLLGKDGPWKQYRKRMMQMRARGFCGRDAFPDALKGLSFAEEAMDIPGEQEYQAPTETTRPAASSEPTRTDSVKAKLRAQVTSVEPVSTPPAEEAKAETPAETAADGTLFDNVECAKPSQLENLFTYAKRKGMKAERFSEILAQFGEPDAIPVTQLTQIQQAIDDALEGGA